MFFPLNALPNLGNRSAAQLALSSPTNVPISQVPPDWTNEETVDGLLCSFIMNQSFIII